MKAKRRRGAQHSYPACSSEDVGSCLLLSLPVELLHHVLGKVDPSGRINLLQTSKVMAKEVMQHSAGRLTFRLNLRQSTNLAAIRQLLQWAPPACLKLKLHGSMSRYSSRMFGDTSDWNRLKALFRMPQAGLPNLDKPRMQRFPCVLDVFITKFSLPSLVPADLAAMCPNMRSLHIDFCSLQHSKQSFSTNSTTSRVMSTGVWPARSLHTLLIGMMDAPQLRRLFGWQPAWYPARRQTRSRQTAETYAAQLRSSAPNLHRLYLAMTGHDEEFIQVGFQVKELHVPLLLTLPVDILGTRLQQVQKLMLEHSRITEAAEMEFLLSLPNLRHVELGTIGVLTTDYSSHPCKWQYLRLHLDTYEEEPLMCIDALAQLPLHSLTQPLALGDDLWPAQLLLTVWPQNPDLLPKLAQRLLRCGVKLESPTLAWSADKRNDGQSVWNSRLLVPALTVISPAFGRQAHLQLQGMRISQPIVEAMAAMHQDALMHLTLQACDFTVDMLPVWRAALAGLPMLQQVTLTHSWGSGLDHADSAKLVDVIRSLATALGQQQVRRCIQLAVCDRHATATEDEAVQLVTDVSDGLQGVVVATKQPVPTGYPECYTAYVTFTTCNGMP